MRNLIDRIRHAVRRRPVRILEALLALLVVAGVIDSPETAAELLELAAKLAVIGGLEVAQRRTTPLADPRAADGRSLVPSDDPHAAHHYEPRP